MNDVLIRRLGSLIDISPDGQSPLPPELVQYLHPKLSYEHKELLRGNARYSPDGRRGTMHIETRNMYSVEQGRLVTGFGFLTAVVDMLAAAGVRSH